MYPKILFIFVFLGNIKFGSSGEYETNEINNSTPEKCMKLMRSANPLVIPRNHKVEEVLNEANKNDLKPLIKLLEILNNPYFEQKNLIDYQKPSSSKEKYQTFCGT